MYNVSIYIGISCTTATLVNLRIEVSSCRHACAFTYNNLADGAEADLAEAVAIGFELLLEIEFKNLTQRKRFLYVRHPYPAFYISGKTARSELFALILCIYTFYQQHLTGHAWCRNDGLACRYRV